MQQTGKALAPVPFRCLSYPFESRRHGFRPQGGDRGGLSRIPLSRRPSLRGIRSSFTCAFATMLLFFVLPFHHYYAASDFPSIVHENASGHRPSVPRAATLNHVTADGGISRVPMISISACTGSSTPGSPTVTRA